MVPQTGLSQQDAEDTAVLLNRVTGRGSGGEEAKAALARIAMGRTVTCVAGHRFYDRVVATCALRGRTLGDLMRAAGVPEGGNGR